MKAIDTSQVLAGIALILVLASGILGAYDFISAKGIQTLNLERREFERILGGATSIIPVYLVLPLLAAMSFAVSTFATRHGHGRSGATLDGAGAVLALISIPTAFTLGIQVQPLPLILAVIGAVVGLIGAKMASTVKGEARRLLTTREVATSAVFAALYAVLIVITGPLLPSPTGGFTHIGDTILYVAAILFGSRVGGLVGAIGAVAADIYTAYPRWYVSIVAHGLQGIIVGSARGKHIILQIVAMAIGGVVMAFTYFGVNVFIRGVPASTISLLRDIFGQAGVSMILALVLSKAVTRIMPSLSPARKLQPATETQNP